MSRYLEPCPGCRRRRLLFVIAGSTARLCIDCIRVQGRLFGGST
jgi:hypothetical protein